MQNLFSLQTPTSKEEYYYRSIHEHFPSDAASCPLVCPSSTKNRKEWDEAFKT
jgi:asparagine synthase (glutamine-hydrolysing)